MSVHIVYKQNGAKMMRPVCTREEYLALRNGGEQQDILKAVRQGDESRKNRLVQMNYSCLPNDDGTLKGSKRMSTTVGMDIDHLKAEEMPVSAQRRRHAERLETHEHDGGHGHRPPEGGGDARRSRKDT